MDANEISPDGDAEETAPETLSPSLLALQEIKKQNEEQHQDLSEKIAKIEEELIQKIKKDQNQKEAFEKLYEEMKQYKDNFLRTAARPIIADLLLLFDNIARIEKKMSSHEEVSKDLQFLREELEEILYRQDVEMITEHSPHLDRQYQRAVQTTATGDPQEDGRVSQVIREGFRWGEHLLRPQEVLLKKYKEPKE